MDDVINLINLNLVNPYITHQPTPDPLHIHPSYPWSADYSLHRQFLVMWIFLYLSSLAIYFISATATFYIFFVDAGGKVDEKTNNARWKWDANQILSEIWVSTWSLFIMSGLTAIMETWTLMGHSYIYKNVSDYGWVYLLISPFWFLIFTDFLIYWIHRGLHHPLLYGPIHKLHHTYKETTPYSAFSFHPLDGFAQSFPYHIFVLFFPMHERLYLVLLFGVGLWTVNIHDRVTFSFWGVNGAAHHTIHHTKFYYNYGQYFIWCDWVFGTYKEPMLYWPYNEKKLLDGKDLDDNGDENQYQNGSGKKLD